MRVISPSAKAATNVGETTRVVGLRTAFSLLIGGLPGLRPMNIPSGSTELGLVLAPDCRRRLRGRSSRWVTSKKEAAPHLSMRDGASYSSTPHSRAERRQDVSTSIRSWRAGSRPTFAQHRRGERSRLVGHKSRERRGPASQSLAGSGGKVPD